MRATRLITIMLAPLAVACAIGATSAGAADYPVTNTFPQLSAVDDGKVFAYEDLTLSRSIFMFNPQTNEKLRLASIDGSLEQIVEITANAGLVAYSTSGTDESRLRLGKDPLDSVKLMRSDGSEPRTVYSTVHPTNPNYSAQLDGRSCGQAVSAIKILDADQLLVVVSVLGHRARNGDCRPFQSRKPGVEQPQRILTVSTSDGQIIRERRTKLRVDDPWTVPVLRFSSTGRLVYNAEHKRFRMIDTRSGAFRVRSVAGVRHISHVIPGPKGSVWLDIRRKKASKGMGSKLRVMPNPTTSARFREIGAKSSLDGLPALCGTRMLVRDSDTGEFQFRDSRGRRTSRSVSPPSMDRTIIRNLACDRSVAAVEQDGGASPISTFSLRPTSR